MHKYVAFSSARSYGGTMALLSVAGYLKTTFSTSKLPWPVRAPVATVTAIVAVVGTVAAPYIPPLVGAASAGSIFVNNPRGRRRPYDHRTGRPGRHAAVAGMAVPISIFIMPRRTAPIHTARHTHRDQHYTDPNRDHSGLFHGFIWLYF